MVKIGWRCYWHKRRRGWQVMLSRRGKNVYVGFEVEMVNAFVKRNERLFDLHGLGGLVVEWGFYRKGGVLKGEGVLKGVEEEGVDRIKYDEGEEKGFLDKIFKDEGEKT